MTFSRSPAIAWAVRPMTGIPRVSGSAFSWRVASQPSTTGRLISHQDQIAALAFRRRDALFAVNRHNDLIAATDEPARKHVPVHLVILDDQDLGHSFPTSAVGGDLRRFW